MPSTAETSPSCMTPSSESEGSSSCRAMRRRTAAGTAARGAASRPLTTGLPSSVKPSAPVSRSSAISVSSAPARPRVIEARKPVGIARVSARRRRERAQDGGGVDRRVGVRHRHERRSRRRRRRAVPLARSSLCSWPGVRKWTCGSTKAGNEVAARAVDARRPRAPERPGRAELGDLPAADEHVLRRASTPARGIEHMRRRGSAGRRAAAARPRNWLMRAPPRARAAAGPRRLAAARRAARRARPCGRRRRPRPGR